MTSVNDNVERVTLADTPRSPSTMGMTSKVVKGSMWTLAGQVLPIFVSFLATPFTIRLLGSEAYGVLLLISLIPTYFNFADFGMGMASTKFASEAFGKGDGDAENKIVWSAAGIATISSLAVVVPLFLFSAQIMALFPVPETLSGEASAALKIASGTFFLTVLANVLNSPMLARLRMDLASIAQALPKILLAALTPVIIFMGGGLLGAISWAFVLSILGLAVVIYFSGRLLPEMYRPIGDKNRLRPLLQFGAGWCAAMVAAMLLINFEKLALTRLISVKALAYYSVAFTFASMAAMFAQAMSQSLVPAFSQLLASGRKVEFSSLFERSMRLNLLLLVPGIAVLVIIAQPFFAIWAGEEFGRESAQPFYILTAGLFFNILTFVPHSTITSVGRSDVFAKLYWIELILYVVAVVILINSFGMLGAAAAWTLRVIFDAIVIGWLSRRFGNASFGFLRKTGILILGGSLLLPAIVTALLVNNYSPWLVPLVTVGLAGYAVVVWKLFLDIEERSWLKHKAQNLLAFTP